VWRIGYLVRRRDPAVVGPAHHHVAEVDHEAAGYNRRIDPAAIAPLYPQAADRIVAIEQRHHALVDVLAGA
jgi:hypothetical protein